MATAFTYTDDLVQRTVKLEVDKALLQSKELVQNIRDKRRVDEYVRSIFHFAHTLGLEVTLKDAERLTDQRKLDLDPQKERLIHNFRNGLDFNRSAVAANFTEVDPALLVHLNKVLLAGWRQLWEAKVREPGENVKPDFDPDTLDEPGNSLTLQADLAALQDWYNQEGNKLAEPLRFAILFGELLRLRPMLYGNFLTLLLYADFLSCRFGFGQKAYFPIMSILDVYQDDLINMWRGCARAGDWSGFASLLIQVWSRELGDLRADMDRESSAEAEKNAKQPFLELNQRQLKILRYLQTIPTLQREDYCQMMEVSTMTAYRDLNELVEKKLLRIDGQGRGTKYMLVTR